MKDQHTKITGYRDLSETEINLMNEAKELANEVGDLIDRFELLTETNDNDVNADLRWLSIAKTDLQKGFMSLVRCIAKPTSF